MIELIKLDSSIHLDIRYARHDNFVGRPVYSEARAFLQRPAADALVRVHKNLRNEGLGLSIFDAYRPWSVTDLFWRVVEDDQRQYVADPAVGSRHNRGCAVDLTLFDLASGKQLEMPSEFDEFNEKSHPDYPGGAPVQRQNRDILRKAMEQQAFTVNPKEWWHFDYKDWSSFEVSDIPFEQLSRTK